MCRSDCLADRAAAGCVSTATLHVHWDFLVNRAALGCVSTASLHIYWDFLVNRAALGCVSTATLHVQFGPTHQQIFYGIFFHGYVACTFRTVSPTEHFRKFIFFFTATLHVTVQTHQQSSSGMNSLDCLTNRAALGWVSTTTLYKQFRLSYQQSSSGMGFHGYAA